MSPIPVIHLLLASGLLIYAARSCYRHLTLLNSFVTVFVLCCSIGLNLLPLFPDAITVAISETALHRTMVAMIIFEAFALVALVLQNEYIKSFSAKTEAVRIFPYITEAVFVTVAASVVISVFLLLWLNANQQYGLFEAYTATSESGQYYQYRKFVEEDVLAVRGRGTWTAKKLVINIGPIVMAVLGYLAARLRRWWLLALLAVQGVLGVLVAGVLAHKSYLLIALFAPVVGALVWRLDQFKKSVAAVLFVAFCLGGVLIFQAATGLSFVDALAEFFIRLVIVPAYVATFYFEVVPDALPFRGFVEMLYMYNSGAPVGDYSVHDVAMAAAGRVYGTNAHFISVAYTGLGFVGVLLISLLALGCVFEVDRRLLRLEKTHRIAAIVISAPAFIGITSVHFLGAIENGFMIQPLAFYLMARMWETRSAGTENLPAETSLPLGHNNAPA
jgi:hypothetical protein